MSAQGISSLLLHIPCKSPMYLCWWSTGSFFVGKMLDFKKYPTQSRVLLRSTLISSGLRHPHYSSHGQLPRIGYFAPKFSPTEELAYQIELAAFVGVGTEWRLPVDLG